MSFKLHGNYCGPGWSAGKWQQSVDKGPPPIDAVDWACARHDAAYARGEDLAEADFRFARDTIASTTPLGIVSGLGVGAQGVLRAAGILSRGGDKVPKNSKQLINHSQSTFTRKQQPTNMARGRIQRGIQAKSRLAEIQMSRVRYPQSDDKAAIAEIKTSLGELKKKITGPVSRFRARNRVGPTDAVVSTAPVSIGTTITASRPTTTQIRGGVRVGGREFMTNVDIRGNTSWQVGALAPIHPMYYIGSVLANTARTYQFYRILALRVHFVTRQATSLAGEVLLSYAANALEPSVDGNSSAFLARAMTQGHATLGPLWQNLSMDVPCDGKSRLVDAFNASTFADNVAGEVQVYTQTAATNDVAGYLMMDYVVEFHDTMFTPHAAALPFASSASTFEFGPIPATSTGSAIAITSNIAANASNGTVFKLVLDRDQSTFGLGWTAGTAFSTSLKINATTSTAFSSSSGFALVDGLALYGVSVGSTFYVYMSYEAAVNGEGSGQVYAQTTSSAASLLAYSAYVVRLSDRNIAIPT